MDKDLVLLKVIAEKEEDVIRQLGELLHSKNYVKDTYISAVVEREKVYPTGLMTASINVAIPHTDTCHVNKTSMAVGVLEKPVTFKMMGNEEESVSVEIVFLLAMQDPKKQVEMLKNIMQLLQDDERLIKIKAAKTEDEVIKCLDNIIGEEART